MMIEQQADSFIARIWLERKSNGGPVWRGHIRQVQGKKETYFQDLAEMNKFLESVSGATGPGAADLSAAETKSSKA
jgi:hypothetical protein|tara:strand:+ start:711 stop:938 length:228 start_codon:yes stop_codon:yes gene_type:complete